MVACAPQPGANGRARLRRALIDADASVELRETSLEQAPLGLVVNQRQCATVGVARLARATEAT
jgi:hypothetical protein